MLIIATNYLKGKYKMKKIVLASLLILLVLVGCSPKDPMALGVYKDRQYTNNVFNYKFEVPETFAYLTSEELAVVNKERHEASEGAEEIDHVNKIFEFSNTNKTIINAMVDSRPSYFKNADKEMNLYLNFLTDAGIKYSAERVIVEIKGIAYERADLTLDFNMKQTVLIAVENDYLLNLQMTYSNGNEADVDTIVAMLSENE